MELKHPLLLASSSPRRQFLMKEAGFSFRVAKPEVDEDFPSGLPVEEVALYLAKIKAASFRDRLAGSIVLAADTVVILDDKPRDREEARLMLMTLSGNTHTVITGVCILTADAEVTFRDVSRVTFHDLSAETIEQYIDQYQPYDKAGAYGVQDGLPPGMNPCSEEEAAFLKAIGNTGLVEKTAGTARHTVLIRQLSGSYFNVMGLPIHRVRCHLKPWQSMP